jgi:hypothetical protein
MERQPPEPGAGLRTFATVARAVGADSVAREAAELEERLAKGRFFVACVGQFKRGKSTLLNALLGRPLLPTGVVPVTTAVTVLIHGPTVTARVRFGSGRCLPVSPEALGEFVSEDRNPENVKGVAAVEVTVPADILRSGMCLVDTPGLGSVFGADSATTLAFVPQIDAALVILGTDPPISSEELALVDHVSAQVDHLVVVLNKSDRVTDADSREAAAFTSRVLERRLRRSAPEVYRVSAVERLAGTATRDWPLLEGALSGLADRSASVVAGAAARGVSRIATALLRDLDEQRHALEQPLEDSERRLAALQKSVGEAGRSLRDLSALMQVERLALSRRFADLRATFLDAESVPARRELDDAVRSDQTRRGPACRSAAIGVAHDVARRRVDTWAREVEPRAEVLYHETVSRFVVLANDFVARLAPDAAAGPLTREEIVVGPGLNQNARFFFTSMLTLAAPGFWAWVLDWMRPRAWLVRSSARHAGQYLDRLMTTNSARMANDLTARVEESQRRLESEIRSRLSRLVEGAERALERARTQRAAGAGAVESERRRLEELRTEVLGARGPVD